jgi:hypothetical protein
MASAHPRHGRHPLAGGRGAARSSTEEARRSSPTSCKKGKGFDLEDFKSADQRRCARWAACRRCWTSCRRSWPRRHSPRR